MQSLSMDQACDIGGMRWSAQDVRTADMCRGKGPPMSREVARSHETLTGSTAACPCMSSWPSDMVCHVRLHQT